MTTFNYVCDSCENQVTLESDAPEQPQCKCMNMLTLVTE